MNLNEYELFGRARYQKFAAVVSELLERAINEEQGFRLQQIQHRAKTVESLSRRLKEKDNSDSDNIEAERKDLAGCRIVFYTNNDVNRLIGSGILRKLFDIDWDRSKSPHPRLGEESAAELFQSDNYVVKLKADRTALLEYREFDGLYCEVQVQTSLNHAWAEMAHDTIYKQPEFQGFGSRELEMIEKRLKDAMLNHLLPAGYLFQRIATDVQRLAEGKALFDAGILDSIVTAENNNDRREHLVRLKEIVLPHYGDLPAIYPEIRDKLKQAWVLARHTETVSLDTPFGVLDGMEPHQVTAEIAQIITQYRYIDPEETYAFIRDLYRESSNAEPRKQLTKVAESLASHTFQMWKHSGPLVQVILAELLANEEDIAAIAPLAITIANKILEPGISGTTSSSNAVTISQGAIVHSEALEKARRTAIDVIANYAASVVADDTLLQSAIESLFAAGEQPRHGVESPDVAAMIRSDLAHAIDRITKFAANASFNARQDIESRLLQYWRWNKALPQHLTSDANVVHAHRRLIENMTQLRETLNADEEFIVFKTLVGFKSVFSHEWEDDSFDFDRDQSIRRQEQEKLANNISKENWPLWKSRLAIAAKVKSRDGATFPPYIEFLSILAKRQKKLAFDLLTDRELMPAWTIHPIAHSLLDGDLRPKVEVLLTRWLDEGLFIQEIATLIAHSKDMDAAIVQKTAGRAAEEKNQDACVSLLAGAVRHFKGDPEFWRDQIFFPCLEVSKHANAHYWMQRLWHKGGNDSLFWHLTAAQTSTLLAAMVEIPRIDYESEQILQLTASRHHKMVLDWFGRRIENAAKNSRRGFSPIPFSFHSMHKVMQPHTADILAAMREWRERHDGIRSWQVSHFLSRIYPNFEEPLPTTLLELVKEADSNELGFIASSLEGFKCRDDLLPLLREVLASEAATDEIEQEVSRVIHETGVMKGEFGRAKTYQAKADMLKPWRGDSNKRVSAFADREIHLLEQQVASETRRAQEEIAMRKLHYGEPLDDNTTSSG